MLKAALGAGVRSRRRVTGMYPGRSAVGAKRNDALQIRDRYDAELGAITDQQCAATPLRAALHPGDESAKRRQRLEHRVRLLELRQVAGARDHLDPRARNLLRKLLRIDRRDDAVGVAPDDQRRRGDAVAALAKAAVGDRPDEFAGAGLRPDELRLASRRARRRRPARRRSASPPRCRDRRTATTGASCWAGSSSSAPDDRQATGRPDRSAPGGRPTSALAAAISAASRPPKEWPTTAGAASLSASNSSP